MIKISSLALLKCPDMDVVELGSRKCNRDKATTRLDWYFEFSWDEGQNCLPGCISRMNENKWDETCCEASPGSPRGTLCTVYAAVDVVEGDNDSKDAKAVKCKGTLGHFL